MNHKQMPPPDHPHDNSARKTALARQIAHGPVYCRSARGLGSSRDLSDSGKKCPAGISVTTLNAVDFEFARRVRGM